MKIKILRTSQNLHYLMHATHFLWCKLFEEISYLLKSIIINVKGNNQTSIKLTYFVNLMSWNQNESDTKALSLISQNIFVTHAYKNKYSV